MNLFNCFQAMAFYTLSPFIAQYLFNHDYNVWGYISSGAIAVGFVTISMNLYDSTSRN